MLRKLFDRLTKMGVRRTVLLVLVTGVVLAGAGFGIVGTVTNDDPGEKTATPTAAPDPPDPPVTPQSLPTATTERAAAPTGGDDAGTAETARLATAEPGSAAPNATLSLSASNPPAVRNEDGAVDRVAGNLTGTLRWNPDSNVAGVTLVVQTWTPDSEWRESRRVAVAPNGTHLAVEAALGSPEQVYAEGERASEFDVDEVGATVAREGYVSVTAVLVGPKGTELERTSTVDDYAFRVTNEETVGFSAFGGSSGLGGSDGEPSLRVDGRAETPTVFDVADVVPGSAGDGRTSITNTGTDAGLLRVSVESVSDSENGRTEPEREVDDSPSEGELSDALDVRIKLEDESGDAVGYLAGDASTYVPLGSRSAEDLTAETRLATDETVSLVVEWRVDADVGNEIQSDSVTLDFDFTVVDDGSQSLGSVPNQASMTDTVGERDTIGRTSGTAASARTE